MLDMMSCNFYRVGNRDLKAGTLWPKPAGTGTDRLLYPRPVFPPLEGAGETQGDPPCSPFAEGVSSTWVSSGKL